MGNPAAFSRFSSTARPGRMLAGLAIVLGLGWLSGRAQPATDLNELRARAEHADVEAQNTLGNAYTNAQFGLLQDHAEAYKWYRRAADQGYPPAQFNLGLAYELGRGMPADERQAFKYYLMAAEQGFAAAIFNVGNMYSAGRGVRQDLFEANLWYRQAAEKGVVDAFFNLGVAHEAGRGVKKDETQAARWYRQAADRGYAKAQYNLGLLLEDGRGVPKSEADAAELYRAAAEQGYAPAQNNFGVMLSEGRGGLIKDPVQALVWLSLAAENGSSPAARDFVARSLSPEQLASARRQLAESRPGKASTAGPEPLSPRAEPRAAGSTAVGVAELTTALETARRANTQLAEANQHLELDKARLQQEVETLAAAPRAGGDTSSTGRSPAEDPDKAATIARLTRDNARLNDEVKRSTRELLSLNQQLRAQRTPAGDTPSGESHAPAPPTDAATGQIAQLTSRVQVLEAQLRAAESRPAPNPDDSKAVATLQDQVQALRGEKAELEKWAQSLEKTLNEKSATPPAAAAAVGEGGQQVARLQKQLDDSTALLAAKEQLGQKLAQDNKSLTDRVSGEHAANLEAQARVAALEGALRDAQLKMAGDPVALNDLKRQLAESGQAVEKLNTTVAELTGANDRLERDLAAARQDLGSLGALRKAADEAATLRTQSSQLARENEQLTATLNGSRRDLEQAQGRAADLEKQLADARTIRTRGVDDSAKLRVELTDAGLAVEKLNATVGELTAANDRLEKDLENSRKGTEAALAAQSQAVTAAQPDAYKLEIGTLQARVKELEGQIEEERNNAAREVATLAAQLQRTRETNKSLTDANRSLLSAKQSEQPVVAKEDFDLLQSRVHDLTAVGEELKRQNQKLNDDTQRLASEREALRQQLEDARKVATVLPGLTDEKTALQERLEAVGTQLVAAQREIDNLQKEGADATAAALASKKLAEKAQVELAGLQSRTAEAENAAEAHNTSVAELTEANTKLETERDDLRKQLTALRADNARLGQTTASLEQVKADSDRSAQQNIDALTTQLAQSRRDLQGARDANSRLAETNLNQERERTAALARMRQENSALTARLTQAQNTLDQIASTARLGTPASTIAAGGAAPSRPVTAPPAAAEVRYHTVAEGDSLSRISMRYYGTANRWQEIYQANRDVLQGSNALRVGMQLRIP